MRFCRRFGLYVVSPHQSVSYTRSHRRPHSTQPHGPMSGTHGTEVARMGRSSLGTAGVYELQLRRKLLQQQLGVVDGRCQRVAKVVAKKHLARVARQEKSGEPAIPSRKDGARRKKIIVNPGGLPSIGVMGGGGGGGGDGASREPAIYHVGGLSSTVDMTGQKPDLLKAAPFKKGGSIDHTRKKQMLLGTQREMERQAALEKKMRPARKGQSVRDEVAAAPSAFPDRYLRGEIPCSKHCSSGH